MRILDVSAGSLAISHATSLLAALGDTVWKVEEPGGDELRSRPPYLPAANGRPLSLPFAVTARGKRWLCLDTTRAAGRAVLANLARQADVVISSDRDRLASLEPRLLRLVVSPFGDRGPRRSWRATSFGLFHVAGPGFVTPRAPTAGAGAQVAPQAPIGNIAEYFGGTRVAGIVSAYGIAPGPYDADISLQECLLPLMRREIAAWQYERYLASRYERLWRVAPSGMYETADGHCYVNVVEDAQWSALCRVMERPDLEADPRFASAESRFVNLLALDPSLVDWFHGRTSAEAFRSCGAAGVPVGPVFGPHDLLRAEHLRSRGSFVHLSEVNAEIPAFAIGPTTAEHAPPMTVGRDTEAVLTEAGVSEHHIADARAARALGR